MRLGLALPIEEPTGDSRVFDPSRTFGETLVAVDLRRKEVALN
jgi:hypothetical protein